MRCADLGPTPGRQRSAWMSSSRAAGFSIAPLQIFTMFALMSAGGSLALVALLFYRRFGLDLDRETVGVFTLFGILFSRGCWSLSLFHMFIENDSRLR